MNEQQLAAVKQALETLEMVVVDVKTTPTAYEAHRQAIADLQSIISQDALYKMAEDAVTIGLSYNDWPKIGCVNHDCDQCKAVQEPGGLAGQGRELHQQLLEAGRELLRSANEPEKWGSVGPGPTEIAWDKFSSLASHVCTGIDSPPAPQPVPVKTYHDGKPWPVAPKPWVGLTDEEIDLFINGRGDEDDDNYVEPTGDGFGLTDADLMTLVRRAEAKLREKNGGAA
jgi:hypothetical protein